MKHVLQLESKWIVIFHVIIVQIIQKLNNYDSGTGF